MEEVDYYGRSGLLWKKWTIKEELSGLLWNYREDSLSIHDIYMLLSSHADNYTILWPYFYLCPYLTP